MRSSIRVFRVFAVGALVVALLSPVTMAQNGSELGLPQGPGNPLADLQRQIDELGALVLSQGQRITALEAASGPLFLAVDCAAGQTVSGALAQVARRPGPVTITITGVCTEVVQVRRDNVTLRGAAPGAGLAAPSAESDVLQLLGSRNVRVNQLKLTGGRVGLMTDFGASFEANDLEVERAQMGLFIWGQTIGVLNRAWIHDNTIEGINTNDATWVRLRSSRLTRNGRGISLVGSHVDMWSTTISGNTEHGVNAMNGTTAYIGDTTIENNGIGILLTWSSTGMLRNSRVTSNGEGISVHSASSLALVEGGIVELNTRRGVSAFASSAVQVNPTAAIQNNLGDGLYLGDNATFVSGGGAIVGNVGWGIRCSDEPAVLGIHGLLDPAAVGANGLGRIHCPPLVVSP